MKHPHYPLIIGLIALPIGLIVGLQISTIQKQYETKKENFEVNVKNAVNEVYEAYTVWNSHTSNSADANSYNSMYTNEDGTFTVLIAQTAQAYPLLDFTPDTLLPKIRKEQFLQFQQELEATRRKENKRLREFYVLRSIQYCADCEAKEYSIAEVFPLDSLIRKRLHKNGIDTETHIGFYHPQKQQFLVLSPGADSVALAGSELRFPFAGKEVLHLHFPQKNKVIVASLMGTLVSSLGLLLLAIACYLIATKLLIRQKKLQEMKTDFINNVTHEFKTPISTINLALVNIENEQVLSNPAYIRQFTKVIKDENNRLNAQVEKVLQAGLIDNKGVELEQHEVDLHQIIGQLCEAYALKLAQEDKLEQKLSAERFVITGDRFHLSNAVSNLLDNAIKYSESPREISIQTQSTVHGLQLSVSDNGLGISSEEQKHIFDKFYRVPTGNLHSIKGFGLGLSYVKAIVAGHGGEIRVESRKGKGSTFIISVPFK